MIRRRRPGVLNTTTPSKNSPAQVSRDQKGNLQATRGADYGGISNETMAEDRKRASAGVKQYEYKPLLESRPLKSASSNVIKAARKLRRQAGGSGAGVPTRLKKYNRRRGNI